ncbi:hypothetical protein Tco_0959739, partial [Tanacetum coccineum]
KLKPLFLLISLKKGRKCSDLELINLCFADDLFIFAHGDPESATVIMEALDEFKNASGLVPSLPKSTSYFCNVLNYTNHAILQILPFEEGRLPMKYLGVHLVSSRLIYRDCKELIEKVQHRIRDWKNKSISAAGRLQLVKSVIGSMHVYWASVFILPSRVLLDFEQLMRNYLWSHGESQKGKSKVAWEVVCLPMKEGGLGVRRLELFNKALMVTHIWNLLSRKESLWVKWVHTYKLRDRHFFEVPLRGLGLYEGNGTSSLHVMGSIDISLILLFYVLNVDQPEVLFAKFVIVADVLRSPPQVIDCIKVTVRLKLLSCYFKKSKDAMEVIHLWELPNSILR